MLTLVGKVLHHRVLVLFLIFGQRLVAEFLANTAVQPLADILCWSILSLVSLSIKHQTVQSPSSPTKFRPGLLWAMRLGLVVSCWTSSRAVTAWIWPALSLALLIGKHIRSTYLPIASSKNTQSTLWQWLLSCATALFSIAVLFIGNSYKSIPCGLVAFAAQLSFYIPLDTINEERAEAFRACDLSALTIDIVIYALPGIALLVGWNAWENGIPVESWPTIAAAGVTKALGWMLVGLVLEEPPWSVAVTSGTFSFSALVVAHQGPSFVHSALSILTAGLAISHTMTILPTNRYHGSRLLYSLLLIPFSFLVLFRGKLPPLGISGAYSHMHVPISHHPIESLSKFYENKLELMLKRQSASSDEAIATYQSKYGREPPPGFAAWFEYAKSHDSVIIDDFDSIEESLRPLRSLSASQLQEAINSAVSTNTRLWHCSVHDGAFDEKGCDWMGKEVAEILADVNEPLPNAGILLNALDEPRVLPDFGENMSVRWIDESRRSSWDRVAKYCDNDTQPVANFNDAERIVTGLPLPFVWSTEEAKNLCRHPEYATMHGFFQSPTTLLFTETRAPIFSPAKPSTFADILYPPPYYMGEYDGGKYQEKDDMEWKAKRPQLYWAGSTTGSYAADDHWRDHHRQRFVARVNQLMNGSATFLNEAEPENWETFHSEEIFSQLYDAKFTAVIQCNAAQCTQENDFFHPSSREGTAAGFGYRFIFDIDGNSFSGRFYTLLLSRSVILKQTIFKEWHDERLMPWIHYIPVSLDMGELPEIMRYLALTRKGSELAEKIAETGRNWTRRALRKEDAGIYMYRLLLELGRLINE